MQKLSRTFVKWLVIFSIVPMVMSTAAFAGSDEDKKAELQKKIKELEEKQAKLAEKAAKTAEKNKPQGKSLDEIIARWETLLNDCSNGRKSVRCADAMYNLASLYYDKARDEYIQKREDYERQMIAYEKSPQGKPEPVNPVPDYSKSLRTYEDLAREYPDFSKISEVYYQMGNTYLLMGDLDRCRTVYTKITNDYPQSPRASMAHFRLSDLDYLEHNNSEAIKHMEKIKEDQVDLQTWEMVHYRKAEIYYNTADFDKAIELFYTYIERCDAGFYKKREFRDMALEFMAICFSDITNGGEEAIKFFKKVGSKSYEADVLYTIGMKNRIHGQWEDAIKSIQTALNRFPYYKLAPTARQMLIECFVVKKQYEKANDERERLVDDYGPGSTWYSKNPNPKDRDQCTSEIKRAIGSIAMYYHALAQRKKDKSLYEKALKRYEDFFKAFPDDKWHFYEYKYNVAEIYNSLGDCERAADNYNYVAMQDISKYPEYKQEIDTLGMDQDEAEKLKKKSDKGPVLISQEDAGYNVIVAYDNCRKKKMASDGINDERAYNLPETRQLLDYAEKYQARFPKSLNAAEVLYLAGNIHYAAKSYDNAIRVFKQINDNYPATKVNEKSLRMLANCYSSSGEYDLAMKMYRQLIDKQKAGTTDQAEVIDLAAGAMYKRAESMEKSDKLGAAEAYKAISVDFPNSKVADRGWFQAGVCYEGLKDYTKAAETFENLPIKFPKSTMSDRAFLRAADNYKTDNKLDKAAQAYQNGAMAISKADFAIPSLSAASECYQKLGQYEMAGKMFEIIFERYSNDPKTPQALYNAGLMFEKGKLYTNAINVYYTLAKKFPESEYAAEAFFSVGLCYEKMSQFAEMAGVFTEYAQKFANDRFKQVQALVKAGNAFFNMRKFQDAEKDYLMAVSVYEKFHKSSDIDVGDIAEAYFRIGDIYYDGFTQVRLEAKNERAMKDLVSQKTKALEESAKNYAKSIELGVEEWSLRSTYMIGKGFVDMAEAIANQSLFGTAEERIGSRVRILSSLDKYYQKAQDYFYKNIEWAHNQNISGPYIDTSIDKFMEMMFRKGDIMEEVGRLLKSAPVPRGLSKEEQDAYAQVLEEKWLEALDAALPRYIEAIKAARQLGIAKNQWLDKVRERIKEIKPDSDELNQEITPWQPKPKAAVEAPSQPVKTEKEISGGKTKAPQSAINKKEQPSSAPSNTSADDETKRELRRIQNIMNMDIPTPDKVKQLNRIEMEAKRNIELEEEKIKELKQK
jgi:tetratricopeptide (TPR) repeat protein